MIENFNELSKYTQNLFDEKNKRQEKYELLKEIKKESLDENVPIITDDVLNFMIFIAKNKKSKRILEVGTATGYSGIFLAQIANENGGFLTTIEIDENRYKKANENFEKMGLLSENKLILGDALEELPKLSEKILEKNETLSNQEALSNGISHKKFDFIFIDAAKGQYLKFFEMCYKILDKNGVIFIDNIVFRGLVAKPKEEVPKRYKTIVKRLNEFIEKLNNNYNFVLLPFGDGVGIVKK